MSERNSATLSEEPSTSQPSIDLSSIHTYRDLYSRIFQHVIGHRSDELIDNTLHQLADASNRLLLASVTMEDIRGPLEERLEKISASMDERHGCGNEHVDEALILDLLDKLTDVEEDGAEGWRRLVQELVKTGEKLEKVRECDFEVEELGHEMDEMEQQKLEHEIEDEILKPAFEKPMSERGAGVKQSTSEGVKSFKGIEKASQASQEYRKFGKGSGPYVAEKTSPRFHEQAPNHFRAPTQQLRRSPTPGPSSNERATSQQSNTAQKGSSEGGSAKGKRAYYRKARNPLTYQSQGLAGAPPLGTHPWHKQTRKYHEAGSKFRPSGGVGRVPSYMYIPLPPGFTITREDGLDCDIFFPSRAHLFYFPEGATREEFHRLITTPHATTWRNHEWTRPYLQEASIVRHDCEDPEFEEIERALRIAIVRQCHPISVALHSRQKISIFEHMWEASGQGTYFLVSNPDVLVDGTPLIVWWNKDFKDWSAQDITDYANWRSQRKAAMRGGAIHPSELQGLSQEGYDASSESAYKSRTDDHTPSEPQFRAELTNNSIVPAYFFMPLPAGFRLQCSSSPRNTIIFPTATGVFHVPGGIDIGEFGNLILDHPHPNMWRNIYGNGAPDDQIIHVISSLEAKRRLQDAIRAQTQSTERFCYGHENDEVRRVDGTWTAEHGERPDTFIVSKGHVRYLRQDRQERARNRNLTNGNRAPSPVRRRPNVTFATLHESNQSPVSSNSTLPNGQQANDESKDVYLMNLDGSAEDLHSINLDGLAEAQPPMSGGGIMQWEEWCRYIDELLKSRHTKNASRTEYTPGTNSERIPMLRGGAGSSSTTPKDGKQVSGGSTHTFPDDGYTQVHSHNGAIVTAPYVQVVIPEGMRVPCRKDPSRNVIFTHPGSLFHFPRGCDLQRLKRFLVRRSSVPRDFDNAHTHHKTIPIQNPEFLRALKIATLFHYPPTRTHIFGYFGDWALEIGDTWLVIEDYVELNGRYTKEGATASQGAQEVEQVGQAPIATGDDEMSKVSEGLDDAIKAISEAQSEEQKKPETGIPQMRGGAVSPRHEGRPSNPAQQAMGSHTPQELTLDKNTEIHAKIIKNLRGIVRQLDCKLQESLARTRVRVEDTIASMLNFQQQAQHADSQARESGRQHIKSIIQDLHEDIRQLNFVIKDLEAEKKKLEDELKDTVEPSTLELAYQDATIRDLEEQISKLESQLSDEKQQSTANPEKPKTPCLRGGAGSLLGLRDQVSQQADKREDTTASDLKRIPSDWKEWKGLPNPGHIPKSDKANTSLGSRKHQEPSTAKVKAPGFYFFPSVSTVALLTDPLHFFQWSTPVGLPEIRAFLQDRKERNIEDRAEFVRIREILKHRDAKGVPDPDTSSGRMVLVHIAEQKVPSPPPSKPANKEASVSGTTELEKTPSRVNLKANLDALNSRRTERGLPHVNFELGPDSDSEHEDRYRNIGGIINLMNNDVASSDEYGPPVSTGSTCLCSVCRPDAGLGLDGTDERPTSRRLHGAHQARGTLRHRQSDRQVPLPDSPTLPYYLYSLSPRPSQHECKSWTGHIDTRNNRCSYCNFDMTELETHLGPDWRPAASRAQSINHEDCAPSPSMYSSHPPPSSIASSAAKRMGDSYPFKVCTNPYACPPVPQAVSPAAEPELYARRASGYIPPPIRLATPMPGTPSAALTPSTPSIPSTPSLSSPSLDSEDGTSTTARIKILQEFQESLGHVQWRMVDSWMTASGLDFENFVMSDASLAEDWGRYLEAQEAFMASFDALEDSVTGLIAAERRIKTVYRDLAKRHEIENGVGGTAGRSQELPTSSSSKAQAPPVNLPLLTDAGRRLDPHLIQQIHGFEQSSAPHVKSGTSRSYAVPRLGRSDSFEEFVASRRLERLERRRQRQAPRRVNSRR